MALLRNLTKRMKVFNLTQEVGKEIGDVQETTMRLRTHNPRTGQVGYIEVPKTIPGSITLLPKGELEVPDEVLDVPEIQNAINNGVLALG
jgi:hypothetical protein